jgi:hypothetical protein
MKNIILTSLLGTFLVGCGTLPREPINATKEIPKQVKKIEMPQQNLITEVPQPVNEVDQSLISKSLTLSPLDYSDPLPQFNVHGLSLSDASISDALTLINTIQPVSFTIDRTVDGLLAQGNTFSADNLSGTFKEVLNSKHPTRHAVYFNYSSSFRFIR